MNEMHFFQLEIDKENLHNYYRWTNKYNRAQVSLYIRKWRVPESVPKIIVVRVEKGKKENIKNFNEIEIKINSERAKQPINSVMERNKEKDRYDSIEINENTSIHNFYIPIEFTFNNTPWLTITVWWDE